MTLQEFINKYNGKIVADGQCGNLVRAYWNEVDHTTPPSYVNSKDYWFNPVPGYDKVASPQPGDIAIYNGHGAYTEGHSAIYVDGRVFEQNADPNGSPAHLYPRGNTYLLGYLRKQGGEEMPNDGDAVNFIRGEKADPNYNPSQAEINAAKQVSFKDWAYKLGWPNQGDAANYSMVYGGDPKEVIKTSHKGWAYKGLGNSGEFTLVTEQLYKKKG